MRRRVVLECDDQRMAFELRLNDAALDAAAASVHEPHFTQSRLRRRVDVFLDDGSNLSRRKRVQIDLRFDWNSYRVIGHHSSSTRQPGDSQCRKSNQPDTQPRVYCTVTIVLMPPRTEKSPTTVMRRG